MSFCGTCSHTAPASSPCAELFQIREAYRAQWHGLTFSVEADSSQWTLRVRDAQEVQTLYTAHRGGVQAARTAAAEFGIFRVLGAESAMSAARLAKELTWQAYW